MTGFRQAQVEAKAAQQRRTPKRKRLPCARRDGHVLECGIALPLSIVLHKLMSIRYGVGIAVSRQP